MCWESLRQADMDTVTDSRTKVNLKDVLEYFDREDVLPLVIQDYLLDMAWNWSPETKLLIIMQ